MFFGLLNTVVKKNKVDKTPLLFLLFFKVRNKFLLRL